MVATIQNGTLRVQFNRVGGCENFSRTETAIVAQRLEKV